MRSDKAAHIANRRITPRCRGSGLAFVGDPPVLALLAEDIVSAGRAVVPGLRRLRLEMLVAGGRRRVLAHILDCARNGLPQGVQQCQIVIAEFPSATWVHRFDDTAGSVR
jgi:hypothetical protein